MNYTKSFLKTANTNPNFKEAVEIAKNNSDGKIWLIGGFVYRNIIQDLYGIPVSTDADFDFIIEKPKKIILANGWKIGKSSYGNPKLIGSCYEIDYIPLRDIYSITRRSLEPTIENYLSGTPLSVQSIVFDIRTNKVVGDVGMRSIKDKIVTVNNLEQAEHSAKKKEISVTDFVNGVADQFGFTPVPPK